MPDKLSGSWFSKFRPSWAELFLRRQLKYAVRNSEYSERTILHRVAEPKAHVNGQDERASPAVDKGGRLRCSVIKGQQQKVLPPLHKKVAVTMVSFSYANIDNKGRYQYNYIVIFYPHIKTE